MNHELFLTSSVPPLFKTIITRWIPCQMFSHTAMRFLQGQYEFTLFKNKCSVGPCACAPECFGTQVWPYIKDLRTKFAFVLSVDIKPFTAGPIFFKTLKCYKPRINSVCL